MGKAKPSKKSRQAGLPTRDLYEADDIEPDEEKYAGQRYDVSICSSKQIARLPATWSCQMQIFAPWVSTSYP
jgi:hypothetical protein